MYFVAVMIPVGIDETSQSAAAENADANARVEDSPKSETLAATVTAEDEVQPTEESRGDNDKQENTESGGEGTAEEDMSYQRCLISSEDAPLSEDNVDLHDEHDNGKEVDGIASSDTEMKPSSQDAEDDKASEYDHQPTDAVEAKTALDDSHGATANEADTFQQDTATESVKLDELNSSQQLLHQTAKDEDETNGSEMNAEEADMHRSEHNEFILEESTTCEVEAAECTAEVNGLEDQFRESISGETTDVVENDKEQVGNEESEQMTESVPEQTGEVLQSVEEPTAGTGTHAESQPEGDISTPEIPASEQNNDNIEQELVVHNETVEQHTAEETEETMADSTDVFDQSTFKSPVSEDGSNKSAEPATESEEPANQALEISTEEDEGHAVDPVESANCQPNETPECVEPVENVSKQDVEDQLTDTTETINEQSDKIETEQQVETTENAEQNEVEVTEVDNKALGLSENSEANESKSTEEVESAHQAQEHATGEEDGTDQMTAADGIINEVHEDGEGTTDKPAEESGAKFDESVEETNATQPDNADEIYSNSAVNTGECNENVPNDCHDEPDKTVQRNIEQPDKDSETKQDETSGEDQSCAQQDSNDVQEALEEAARDDEVVQVQASETGETTEMMPEQTNVDEREETVTNTVVNEESAEVERLAAEETTAISETVDNAESGDCAEYDEQNTEPATEIEARPTSTDISDKPNEAVEPATDVSEENAASNQPYENIIDSETKKIENQSKSETTVDETSNIADAENTTEHHETESCRTAEFEEQPGDISEPADDNAPSVAVEPCDSEEVDPERMTEREMDIERPTATAEATDDGMTESTKEFNESCVSDTRDVQAMADSSEAIEDQLVRTADDEQAAQHVSDSIAFDADEQHDNKMACEDGHIDETVQDVLCQPHEDNKVDEVNEDDDTTVETEKAEQSIAETYDTTDTVRETETTQSGEVTATCSGTSESNDNTMSASDDVPEVGENDNVSQQDPEADVYGESDGISNRQIEEAEPEPPQLINRHDSPVFLSDSVENPESIRYYVDGCRDIELSGMKLASDQVSCRTEAFSNFCTKSPR